MSYAKKEPSLSLSQPNPQQVDTIEKTGLAVFGVGLVLLLVAAFGAGSVYPLTFLVTSLGLITGGGALYFIRYFNKEPAGVKNHYTWFSSLTARGIWGWIMGVTLTGFYVLLYWFPSTLEHLIGMMDPLSQLIRGEAANQWFLYGTFYTMAILVMGVKAMYKYRHTNYQLVRTSSVIAAQLFFAFLIPNLLVLFNQPEYYFSYFWPLKPEYLYPGKISSLLNSPAELSVFMAYWGILISIIGVPILTYFYGKRWYCSWVCGCGGLANTFGDDFRHLSDNSLRAWKVERWMVHSVLVFITATTLLLWTNSYMKGALLGDFSQAFSKAYGFLIIMVFSGVIGVGFYPLMGTRVWCRFGCPQAAILGILQKYFSRFRITTNGGQCISCGNCSEYCEMGIDVRAYAQRGQNVIRASCVGCGMCATVCPRGVLRLENGPREGRYNEPLLIREDKVDVVD